MPGAECRVWAVKTRVRVSQRWKYYTGYYMRIYTVAIECADKDA